MTFYKRYSETQRNDPELREAVRLELAELNDVLTRAKAKLESAYALLLTASTIEETELDCYSSVGEARLNVYSAIRKFEYKITEPTETYVGNVAAAMSAIKAEELKEKYRAG